MARLRVIIRRHYGNKQNSQDKIIHAGGISIDPLGHEVYVDGEKAELTAKEYSILLYMVKNKGIVLSRGQDT